MQCKVKSEKAKLTVSNFILRKGFWHSEPLYPREQFTDIAKFGIAVHQSSTNRYSEIPSEAAAIHAILLITSIKRARANN